MEERYYYDIVLLKDWPHGEIHVGEIYASPLGVVSSLSSSKATVVTSGIVNTHFPLVPGKEYSGNSNGRLIEGYYAGQINAVSYPLSVHNVDVDQILTTDSLVGIAISENQLIVTVKDRIRVCYFCCNK